MNLGEFIDDFKEAISRRVVESYPPLYRPSDNGGRLPYLLRKPLGAQADAIRGAALSLKAHRGTTVVGEMGTGKTFIGAAAAYTAGFNRVLIICPPHLTKKWKREVEQTVPGARAAIVTATFGRLGAAVRGDEQGTSEALLPLEGRRRVQMGEVEGEAHQDGENGRAVPCALLHRLHGADNGQGRRAPHRRRTEPTEAHMRRVRVSALAGRQVRPGPLPAQRLREAPDEGLLRPAHRRRGA